MNVFAIIDRFYPEGHPARDILMAHSTSVRAKALAVARKVEGTGERVDLAFIEEAAMLHDIGIFKTHAPDIGCTGEAPYIVHGVIGRELLEELGYPRHARVCERHTGCGLLKDEIINAGLPLPHRDLVPETLEEIILCYADKFFSKNPGEAGSEKPVAVIRKQMEDFGSRQLATFDAWHSRFA